MDDTAESNTISGVAAARTAPYIGTSVLEWDPTPGRIRAYLPTAVLGAPALGNRNEQIIATDRRVLMTQMLTPITGLVDLPPVNTGRAPGFNPLTELPTPRGTNILISITGATGTWVFTWTSFMALKFQTPGTSQIPVVQGEVLEWSPSNQDTTYYVGRTASSSDHRQPVIMMAADANIPVIGSGYNIILDVTVSQQPTADAAGVPNDVVAKFSDVRGFVTDVPMSRNHALDPVGAYAYESPAAGSRHGPAAAPSGDSRLSLIHI